MNSKKYICFNIFLGFLLLLSFQGQAQKELSRSRTQNELDSLEQRLHYYNEIQEDDTVKINLYIDLAISFSRKDISKSFHYGNSALSLSKQTDYRWGIAKAQQILGYLNILRGEITEAIDLTRSSLSIFKTLDKPVEINNSLINLALCYLTREEYDRAIEYYLDALPLLYAEQDTFNLSRAHFNIAKIYQDLEQDSLALEHYNNVLDAIRHDQNRPVSSSLVYQRLSEIYFENGDLDKAKKYVTQAIELKKEIADDTGLAECQIMLGKISLKEDPDKALQYFRTALGLLDKTARDETWSDAYHGMATIFLNRGDTESTLFYGEKAYDYAEKSESDESLLNASKLLASAYEKRRDFDKANRYQRQYSMLQESLFSKKQAQQLAVMTSRFEIEDRELRIDLLEKENQLKQIQLENEAVIRYSLIGGTALLLIILILIGYGYRIKKETTNKLEKKNEQLEQLNNEKNMFMRMAAHDLKNPLAAITGLADLIKMEESSNFEDVQEYATNILLVSERMNEIIKNLLDVEAIESGEEIIRPKPIELHLCIKKVADQYQRRAREKQIQLHCEPPDENLRIFADESAVDGVLENLVSNAIKYSHKNKNVWIKAYSENDSARIEVQDEGPGLTEEDKKNLFKKFKPLSAKPTGGEHSNGLGLYIVKNMVERMNGSIACKSTPGEGTTFMVDLPKAPSGID